MRTAALYIHGRIVVGRSHLEAFEQLSEEEKCSNDISSGFFDNETGEFAGYDAREHFYNKKILLIRHGKSHQDSLDPGLCEDGVSEVEKVLKHLSSFDLEGFMGYTSPLLRCLETTRPISESTGVRFAVRPELMETPTFLEPGESYWVQSRKEEFPEYDWPAGEGWDVHYESYNSFRDRTHQILKKLPNRTILISHRGVVTNMAKLALCDEKVTQCGVPTASVTYIDNREVKCLGRTLYENDCEV